MIYDTFDSPVPPSPLGFGPAPLPVKPPFLWPDTRYLGGHATYPEMPPMAEVIRDACLISGVLVDVTEGTLRWLHELLSLNPARRIRLVLVISPACPTREEHLREIIKIQESFPGANGCPLEVRILAMSAYFGEDYYDPYSECSNLRQEIHGIALLVRPLLQGNAEKSQLCQPTAYAEEGDDFSDCQLFSIVAWDHVSWPGNDYFGGSRSTDDGVKAAATDSMAVLTGYVGYYDAQRSGYLPPAPYRIWAGVVEMNRLRLTIDQPQRQPERRVAPITGGAD